MKWKIDYPYLVCIVFLIGTGIWMNYLSIKKQGLEKEVELFRQETERLGQFYQQVTDLYFTGLQVVTIDPGQVQADSLKEGVVICLPTTPLDSLEGAAFKYTLSRLQTLKGYKVGVWLYGEATGEVADWVKEYGYDCIYSGRKPNGLPDASIFYLDTGCKAEALFKLQPYAVHLLNKYMKFLRDHYMAGGIGVRTNEQQPELIQ